MTEGCCPCGTCEEERWLSCRQKCSEFEKWARGESEMKINDYVAKVHENAVNKGFWDKPRETGTLLALIHSEVSEALEADRKKDKEPYYQLELNQYTLRSIVNILKEYPSTHKLGLVVEENAKYVDPKENFTEELADTVIRIFDLCGGLNIDLQSAIDAKMAKNANRPKLHGKRY